MEVIYLWADGLYVKAGLEDTKAALLVMIGVRANGQKVVLAVETGQRESKESWGMMLRNLRKRGLWRIVHSHNNSQCLWKHGKSDRVLCEQFAIDIEPHARVSGAPHVADLTMKDKIAVHVIPCHQSRRHIGKISQ